MQILQSGLGPLFAPLAWLMGVENADLLPVGRLLGLKRATNELIAYQQMGEMPELSERSRIIATYALCGFANLGSIGGQIGGLGYLAPDRKTELARLGFRAMLGGTLACCMTACVASILIAI